MGDHVETVVAGISDLVGEAGGVDRLATPRGWSHMGLVIVDAVFSLQAPYDSVVKPLLARYCGAAPGISWVGINAQTPEHDAEDLVDFLGAKTLEQRYGVLNRQIAPGTARGHRVGIPKADTVVAVARVMVDHGSTTRDGFVLSATRDSSLEKAVRKVPGVGYACWTYMLSLSGVEVSKPDTMILRWLREVTGEASTPTDAGALIEIATARLQAGGMDVTVRQVDHLVWRKASGRPLTT